MWLTIFKNWKGLALIAGVLGIIVTVAILSVKLANVRSDNTVLRAQMRQDSIRILNLERENVALIADTTKYRADIVAIGKFIDQLESVDKKLGKELSTRFPSIEQIKNKNPL